MSRWLRIGLVAGLLTSMPQAVWALAPMQDWQSIPTHCCDVHYPQRLQTVAPRIAALAEQVDAEVSSLLGASPRDRVQIVLEDETDAANGWALTVPYDTIHLYIIAPDNYSALGDTDDWLHSLLVHEYTHIVHLDMMSGVPAMVNRVIGKQWAPNQVQPGWFIEGMATYAETRFSTGGRIRSSLHDMHMRTAARARKVLTFDEVSNSTRQYPRGAAWMYGGRFLSYIVDRYDEGVLAKLANRYGSQLIPFGLNRSAENILHTSYDELYRDFISHLQADADSVQQRIDALGADNSQQITTMGETVQQPLIIGDSIYFFASPENDSPALYQLQQGQSQPERIVELHGFAGMAVIDSNHIVIAQPELFAAHYAYNDLFQLDLRTRQMQRLTVGLRASSPCSIPASTRIVFVRRQALSSALSIFDSSTNKVRDLVRFDDGSQFFTPAVSQDGSYLVVSLWRPGGNRDLWRVSLANGDLQQLTDDRAMDLDPAFNGDGTRVFFSSDRDDIFNIYELDLASGRVTQVSNVFTGAFAPTWDARHQQLVFLGYHVDGYDLFRLAIDAALNYAASPSYERPLSEATADIKVVESHNYNPLPSLLPHAWLPLLSTDSLGPVIGAAVDGRDAVGVHEYAAQASLGVASATVQASLGYAYNDLPAPVHAALSLGENTQLFTLSDSLSLHSSRIRRVAADIVAYLPVRQWLSSHSIGLGYGLNWTQRLDSIPYQPDATPLTKVPWTGRTGVLRLVWSYSSTQRFVHSVSSERGIYTSLRFGLADPWLGSQSAFFEVSGDGGGFLQVPGLPGHVVALMLSAGYAVGLRDRRRLFGVGGMPERDIVQDLLNGGRVGGGYLRGYPNNAFVGDGQLVINAEYRLPLLEVEHGYSTLPLFFDRVYAVLFADIGGAFIDDPTMAELLHRSLGAELRADLMFAYRLPVEIRMGVARGFDEGGLDAQPYFALGLPN